MKNLFWYRKMDCKRMSDCSLFIFFFLLAFIMNAARANADAGDPGIVWLSSPESINSNYTTIYFGDEATTGTASPIVDSTGIGAGGFWDAQVYNNIIYASVLVGPTASSYAKTYNLSGGFLSDTALQTAITGGFTGLAADPATGAIYGAGNGGVINILDGTVIANGINAVDVFVVNKNVTNESGSTTTGTTIVYTNRTDGKVYFTNDKAVGDAGKEGSFLLADPSIVQGGQITIGYIGGALGTADEGLKFAFTGSTITGNVPFENLDTVYGINLSVSTLVDPYSTHPGWVITAGDFGYFNWTLGDLEPNPLAPNSPMTFALHQSLPDASRLTIDIDSSDLIEGTLWEELPNDSSDAVFGYGMPGYDAYTLSGLRINETSGGFTLFTEATAVVPELPGGSVGFSMMMLFMGGMVMFLRRRTPAL